MKLLFVLPEYLPQHGGGIITFYRTWLPLLASRGHEVHVLVGSAFTMSDEARPVVIDGVHVDVLDRRRFLAHLPAFSHYAATPGLQRYLAAAWALFEQAERGRDFDLVETTDWGLLFAPWIIEQTIPTLTQMHGSCGQIDLHDPVVGEEVQGHLIRLIEKLGVARSSGVQSYSPANSAFWQAESCRDVDHLPPAFCSPLKQPDYPSRNSHGLVVGRVQRWKGPRVLCEALRLLGDHAPQIDWMGRDTPYVTRSQTTSQVLAAEYPGVWNARIRHKPPQPFEVTAALQAQAAFVVVPSSWDVFNFTCVEAMAAGTPVICSDGAGASHWIEDGANGFRFDREDAASLADALRRLLALGEEKRREIGDNGRRTIAEALDPEKVSALRLQAYDALQRNESVPLVADDWLRMAAGPGRERLDGLRLLDHLPLRGISRYVIERAIKKVRRA